jgi:hypothetical protein
MRNLKDFLIRGLVSMTNLIIHSDRAQKSRREPCLSFGIRDRGGQATQDISWCEGTYETTSTKYQCGDPFQLAA